MGEESRDASGGEAIACPSCGTRGSGKYCAECAAPLVSAGCASCATPLVAGASFCYRCGASVHAAQRAPAVTDVTSPMRPVRSHALSWAVGVGAFVALAAFVVTQRSVEARASGDVAPAAMPSPLGDAGAVRAPDISNMTPRERAERLYDRAMMAKQEGKTDSATFFASMATMAYGQLDSPSLDDRYDLGRLALMSGSVPLARAEADTILAARPTHLLGLMLAEDAARAAGDESKAKAAHAKLLASTPSERRGTLPEYRLHAAELDAALGVAAPAPLSADSGRATP